MEAGAAVTYSWVQAVARVETLKREFGIWPGIVLLADGRCVLTYDPPTMLGKYAEA